MRSEAEHHREFIAALSGGLVAVAALASLIAAVLSQERLRAGLVIGLIPFVAVLSVAYVVGRRYSKGFAGWVVLFGASLAILPVAEIALYPLYAVRQRASLESATSDADKAASRLLNTVDRRDRDGIPMLAATTSPFLNINPDGFRAPVFQPHDQATTRVAIVGGSAVFGTRLADESTLPSQVAAHLRRLLTRPVEVLNLGQEAITCATEVKIVASLIDRLSPDVVVFHHGANDFAIHGWVAVTSRGSQSTLMMRETLRSRAADRINQSLLLSRVSRLLSSMPSAERQAEIVDRALDRYAEGRRHAEALCAQRKVRCLFFLQPIITDRHQPSFSEAVELQNREGSFRGFGELYGRFADAVIARFPHTHDLRDAISSDRRVMFIDWVHLSKAGNDLLAEPIAGDVANAVVATGAL